MHSTLDMREIPRRLRTLLAAAACVAAGPILTGACVTTGTYKAKQGELDQANQKLAAGAKREADLTGEVARLRAEIAALSRRLSETEQTLARTAGERDQFHRDLDGSTALVGELQERLRRLGQDVDKLAGQRGEMSKALAVARARLEELRRQSEAAETRAETYRQLVHKLHAMIAAGSLQVIVRDGRMLIVMPMDVLFDSGRTLIRPDAQDGLATVAQVLREIPNRKFRVDGHTDNVPIHTARFASNWELSAARAIAVAHLLVAYGLDERVVSIGGHADLDPVALNDSDEHRGLNRRIEIVLEPNLSELPELASVVTRQEGGGSAGTTQVNGPAQRPGQ